MCSVVRAPLDFVEATKMERTIWFLVFQSGVVRGWSLRCVLMTDYGLASLVVAMNYSQLKYSTSIKIKGIFDRLSL